MDVCKLEPAAFPGCFCRDESAKCLAGLATPIVHCKMRRKAGDNSGGFSEFAVNRRIGAWGSDWNKIGVRPLNLFPLLPRG